MLDSGRNIVMRRLEIDFDQEVPAGIALKVGVRASSRSRRAVIYDEAVWRVDPPVTVARARSVHVVVRTDTPGAIEIPDELIGPFEAYEGRRLPL